MIEFNFRKKQFYIEERGEEEISRVESESKVPVNAGLKRLKVDGRGKKIGGKRVSVSRSHKYKWIEVNVH